MTVETPETSQRLGGQLARVLQVVRDGKWRTLSDIRDEMHSPVSTQSISARLRDFRKLKFGNYLVERRSTGTEGLHEYRVDVNQNNPLPTQGKAFDADAVFKAAEALVARAQATDASSDFSLSEADDRRAAEVTLGVIQDIVSLVRTHSS